MIHALISLITCAIFILLKLPPWLCLLPAVWYMGREYAQAEYRWIEDYGDGKRANMPWYAPLTPAAWTAKGMLDWILPLLVCFAAALVARWLLK